MSSTLARWSRRLRRVTARDVRLLVEAQRDLIACQIAKWRRPVGELLDWSGRDSPAGAAEIDYRALDAVAWAVLRAARYGLFRPRCLVRALAIQRMLRRRGVHAGSLAIGVRRRAAAFEAHAWVELDGIVIGDSSQHVQTFTRITDHRLVEL